MFENMLRLLRDNARASTDPDWPNTFIVPDDIFATIQYYVSDIHGLVPMRKYGYQYFSLMGEFSIRPISTDQTLAAVKDAWKEVQAKG